VRDQDGHLIGDSPEIYVRLDDPNFFSTDHLGLFLRVEVKVDIFWATMLGPKPQMKLDLPDLRWANRAMWLKIPKFRTESLAAGGRAQPVGSE